MSGRWDNKTQPKAWIGYAFIIFMMILIFAAGYMFGTWDVTFGWVYWIYESFEPFYWNIDWDPFDAYAVQLSTEELYIISNAPHYSDYSNWEQVYIYNPACLHHPQYYKYERGDWDVILYNECKRYINWRD